ncbi:MAG TPA: type II toxin-antitoxin system HicB family antitoxin [Verrucomicrobiae bacterium]|jgi:predicted RNase H-like HicB family nuclease|nr:type II toxin-antitoxin system HicB family antitoxin [Verrucomicrobiae bacterium]
MKTTVLKLVIYKEGKHYVAQCLDVDVSSFGKSEAEAVKHLQEALELYFEDADVTTIETAESPKLRTLRLQHA